MPRDLGLKQLYTAVDLEIEYVTYLPDWTKSVILTFDTSIVAVHGAKGHREKSWTASNGVNWLRDLLPNDLPNANVYTWGYGSGRDASLQSISESMVLDLWETREANNVRTSTQLAGLESSSRS